MKALFFDGDLYMGMKTIGHPLPEYKMALPKRISLQENENLTTPKTQMIYFIYRLQDRGRDYLIYSLAGIEE